MTDEKAFSSHWRFSSSGHWKRVFEEPQKRQSLHTLVRWDRRGLEIKDKESEEGW